MTSKYDGLGFYHDPADPRLLVPKSNPALGWTLNLSHRYGWLALAALLVVTLAPLGFVAFTLLHQREP
jgi:uncharacterized membrane protein